MQAGREKAEAEAAAAHEAADRASSLLSERDAFWTVEVKQLRERLDKSQQEVGARQALPTASFSQSRIEAL